ncbi:MAG: MFS transporter [Chloroflexota bacterium]|nr:MFS transporter [Chloroflexota bacterium]
MRGPQHLVSSRLTDANTKWFTLASACTVLFMVMLDNLVVNVAMPTISREFAASTSALQWIVSAYTLVFASLQITAGGLGDRFGRKRWFLIGIMLFGLTSAAAAFSQSVEMLIAARAVQGLAAAFILPLSLSLVSAAFPPEERGRAIGIWSAISVSGLAFGPIIGGVVVQYFTWNWVFLINIPIVVVAYLIASSAVQESRDTSGTVATDVPGTLLVTGAIGSLTWGLIEAGERGWGSPFVLGTFAISAVLFAAFIWVESRTARPMVPLSFFRSLTFSGANIDSFFISFMIAGLAFSLTLYMQNVHGMSPIRTGLTLLPMVITQMIVTPIVGSLVNRVGPRRLISVGMLIVAGAALLFLRASPTASFVDIIPAMVVMGFGSSLVFAPITTSVLNSVPTEKSGVASAVNGATRETGFAFGIALLGSVMNRTYQDQFAADANVAQVRAVSEATGSPLGGLIDFVGEGMNAAGWVVEDPRLYADLPAGVLAQLQGSGVLTTIRQASSEAFVAGMHWSFIISSIVLAAAAVLSWFLIEDKQVVGARETRRTPATADPRPTLAAEPGD